MTILCDTCHHEYNQGDYLWRCHDQNIIPSLNVLGPTCANCVNGHINVSPHFCDLQAAMLNNNGILPNGYLAPGGPPPFNMNGWGNMHQPPGHGGGAGGPGAGGGPGHDDGGMIVLVLITTISISAYN